MVISPVSLVCNEKDKEVALSDLKEIIKHFPSTSYQFHYFQWQLPEGDNKKLMKRDEMAVIAVLKTKSVVFTDCYFGMPKNDRIAYLFHEVCHFHTYSSVSDSMRIWQELENNRAEYWPNRHNPSKEQCAKESYGYCLTMFNEQLADKAMLEYCPDLLKIKMMEGANHYLENIKQEPDLQYMLQVLLDADRCIELVKDIPEFEENVKERHKLRNEIIKQLKADNDTELINLLIEYEGKMLEEIKKENAEEMISVFNEFISKVILR